MNKFGVEVVTGDNAIEDYVVGPFDSHDAAQSWANESMHDATDGRKCRVVKLVIVNKV